MGSKVRRCEGSKKIQLRTSEPSNLRTFTFLTGPSGAGKSSLLRLMYLGAKPTQGEVYLFDKKVDGIPRAELPALRRRVGVVFQDFRLLPHLTALENVALPLRLAGADTDEIEGPVRELMEWVGLSEQIDAYPAWLSGGEQQRVAIARAVVGRPQILLADEPAGSVDEDSALRLMHLFLELNKLGTTVVVATHNRALMERVRKPVLHLHKGEVSIH
ncbi:MAG: ATP-binding cassette domain-containing protein [Proteobacteria bacterium]|nr:ATP-binding cassette domain-containing protein [Pseudomonadota bacterium]